MRKSSLGRILWKIVQEGLYYEFWYVIAWVCSICQHVFVFSSKGGREIEDSLLFNVSAPNPCDLYAQLGDLLEILPHVDNTHNPKEGKGNIK